ncbi:MAG: sulfate transporter [Deltaproteobacteria bacterium CG_4_10_14_0_2_um_filter_43_8]|nr:MAG: sulfate transporter [Deltaproteobacteria bacterium CG11_big_fil_rev_8_21_14_0_20_42_23]PJA21038.1 MAG: sulfate transporter [Deltaproteobacteria bacterium CG_4_10_14_0_2_um_filter_43_8]PJC64322.1 MAG: sulfate transporter [Deltaproteobacteria bacterium CG_4_9_14_0_2_um_filter_42_21]
MKINVEANGPISIVHCGGSLDADSVGSFKKITNGLIENGAMYLVMDFQHMPFIDSMGLGALISLQRKIKQADGVLKVASLCEDVKTIFEITRLHRLFEVCQDLQAACEMPEA